MVALLGGEEDVERTASVVSTGELFDPDLQVCHSHLPLFVHFVEDELLDGRRGSEMARIDNVP
jgi:hypothetical protein